MLVERALKNKDWEELREFLRYDSGELLHYCAVRGEEARFYILLFYMASLTLSRS